MKKKIGVVALVASLCMMAFTTPPDEGKPCERLDRMHQWMKDSLGLTSDQDARIIAINDSACTKLQAVRANHQGDKEAMRAESRKIMEETRNSYKSVLTPAQQKMMREHFKGGNGQGRGNPQKRVQKMTDKMRVDLGLNDSQTSQVKAANEELMQRMSVLKQRKQSGEDKTQLRKTAKLIRNEYDAKIKAVLTADQQAKWEQMKKDAKAKREAKKANK